MTSRKVRTEGGSAVVEFVMLTVVVIVPLFYIVMAVFHVQRASFGVTAASVAGARAFVQADSLGSAERQWETAAKLTLVDHGVVESQISRRCEPQCFVPGSIVEVRIVAQQPLPLAPRIFGEALTSVTVESVHREPFGRYRADGT